MYLKELPHASHAKTMKNSTTAIAQPAVMRFQVNMYTQVILSLSFLLSSVVALLTGQTLSVVKKKHTHTHTHFSRLDKVDSTKKLHFLSKAQTRREVIYRLHNDKCQR